MSPWNGPAYPGAKRDLRKLKRTEAEDRNALTPPQRRSRKRQEPPEPSGGTRCPLRPDKTAYASPQAAAAVMVRLPKLRKRQGLNPYRCPGGGHYHLGRQIERATVAYRSRP